MSRVLPLLALALAVALPSPASAKKLSPGESVDLNTASADELARVPGIGPKKAADVVAWRDAHGPFTRVDQLDQVKGFGKKALSKVAPYLRLGDAPPSEVAAPSAADEGAKKKPRKAAKTRKLPPPEGADADSGAPHKARKAPPVLNDEGRGKDDVETL